MKPDSNIVPHLNKYVKMKNPAALIFSITYDEKLYEIECIRRTIYSVS